MPSPLPKLLNDKRRPKAEHNKATERTYCELDALSRPSPRLLARVEHPAPTKNTQLVQGRQPCHPELDARPSITNHATGSASDPPPQQWSRSPLIPTTGGHTKGARHWWARLPADKGWASLQKQPRSPQGHERTPEVLDSTWGPGESATVATYEDASTRDPKALP